jgi:hypothetical protein
VLGETVEFSGGTESTRLVTALAQLSATPEIHFVLVGGLAVAARLRTFHRATQDLDALVTAERSRFHTLTLETVTGATISDDRLSVEGVRVDVIEVDPTTTYQAIADLPEPIDRLFTAGHLYAHRDESPLTIRSSQAHATVRVATARALLVTKLHACHNPRRDPRKHSSDTLDVIQLGRQLVADDGGLAASEIPTVVRLLQRGASRSFVIGPTRWFGDSLPSDDQPQSAKLLRSPNYCSRTSRESVGTSRISPTDPDSSRVVGDLGLCKTSLPPVCGGLATCQV